jgi:hypothetical protein
MARTGAAVRPAGRGGTGCGCWDWGGAGGRAGPAGDGCACRRVSAGSRLTAMRPLAAHLEQSRSASPIGDPGDVARCLASHARDALRAVEQAPAGAMEELSEALSDGVGFDLGDAKGRRFFCSTLVQTLFYGVFSAWVLWGQQPRAQDERFAWRASADLLHLPLLTDLFHAMTRPGSPFAGALRERLDLAEWTLNRVDREAFFTGFPEEEAVQYFYEPFLEAFDADLRRQLGGLVHAARGGALYGRAGRPCAARGAGSGAGARRPERCGARSRVRHRGLLSGRFAAGCKDDRRAGDRRHGGCAARGGRDGPDPWI